ncbi:MAG: MTH938/NDUFAF3 family protein [bacterium]|nr:MTH938/NDUFAF3 family protein [bacterium]
MHIDSYDFGKIVINGQEFRSDVIIYPDYVDSNWWRKIGHELGIVDVGEVLTRNPEILIIGTGYFGFMRILPETEKYLQERHIRLLAGKTGVVCKEYNQLAECKTQVIAMMHLTC